MQNGASQAASVLAVLDGRRDDLPEQLRVAQDLIEVLPIPVFFKARDGKYLGVNRAWEDYLGVERAAILGHHVIDLYPEDPATARRHQAMDEELWARPGQQSYE